MSLSQLDAYQQQHSKYFNYQYIPPRLVERIDASATNGNANGGTGTGAYDEGMMDFPSSICGSSCLVWYIIVIIMLLSVFLLIGIMSVRSGNFA